VGLLLIFVATTATTTTHGFRSSSPSHPHQHHRHPPAHYRGVTTTTTTTSQKGDATLSLRFTQQWSPSAVAMRFTTRGQHSPKTSSAGYGRMKRFATSKATDVSATSTLPTTKTTKTTTTTTTLLSALLLIGLDIAFRRILQMASISFPSSLAGCGTLFATMLLVPGGGGESLFQVLTPGAALLAKWLPVFFVPSLVTLPLASGFGSFAEVRERQKYIYIYTHTHTHNGNCE
jgi:hypothetical protein